MKINLTLSTLLLVSSIVLVQCKKDDNKITPAVTGKDPNTAEKVSIDRFSSAAGHLQVRDASNGLPTANAPVNFDVAPFITKGLSPSGQPVEYYNFDVQSTAPAPIYVLFKKGSSTPVQGQLNIIDKIPGEAGYNDFWLINKVEVPDDYVTNSITSLGEIQSKGYSVTPTNMIVNCPVVPDGSTATKRVGGGSASIIRGWYKGKVVTYFSFEEKALTTTGNGMVPTSPIYVTFNVNPDQTNGGPASGFKTEMGNMQTHNVVATLPADGGYSPLWSVNVYDNMDFSKVNNFSTVQSAKILAQGVALVNCPIVSQ
ncbi:MAG: hypothetical protein JNK00_01000 [Flavipsychrobacter sp.]|nr:hypothetical protein [Flavipsychrobacter sp.]